MRNTYKTLLITFILLSATQVLAQDSGTINRLDQWSSTTTPQASITQRIWGKVLKLTGYNAGCLEVDVNGIVTSTGSDCGAGAGSGNFSSTTPWTDGDLVRVVDKDTITSISTSTLRINTDDLIEGVTNLFYTQARVWSDVWASSTLATLLNKADTAIQTETDPQFDTKFSAKTTTNLTEGTNLYYTLTRWATAMAGTTTDALTEGSNNLYWTIARFRAALLGGENAILGNATTTNATSTNQNVSSELKLSYLASGLLKAVSGVVGLATAGVDYENPLTFTYPIQRVVNTISLAFGTTTSNTWGGTQTFTNQIIAPSIDVAQVGSSTATTTFPGHLKVDGDFTVAGRTTVVDMFVSSTTVNGDITSIGQINSQRASTSALTVFGNAYIPKLSNLTSNGFVKTSGSNGTLSVDTTTYESGLTAGDGLTRTVNDFDCDTANGSTFGCLTAADWTTFNKKLSSYDAWTHPAAGKSATTSELQTTGGLLSTASSTFTDTLNVAGRLTITGAQDTGGNLRFSAANPYIYASSYITMPGGLYVSGGTAYFANEIRTRNGIANDSTPFGGDVNINDSLRVVGNASTTGYITSGGDLLFSTIGSGVRATSTDGADNSYLCFAGGGACATERGGYLQVFGNEFSTFALNGSTVLNTGNHANAQLLLQRAGTNKLVINTSGNTDIYGDAVVWGGELNTSTSSASAGVPLLISNGNTGSSASAGGLVRIAEGGDVTSTNNNTGGAGANTYISNGGDGNTYVSDTGGAAGNVYLAQGGDGTNFGNDGSVYIGRTGGKNNAFLYMNGTTTVSGKMYIGTSTSAYSSEDGSDPVMTLYTTGNPILDIQSNSTNASGIRFVKGGDSMWYISARGSGDTASPNALVFYKTSGVGSFPASARFFSLTQTGEVGIATSTPWKTLSVVGTMAVNGLSTESGSDNYVCIDPTNFEITNGGANCAASARRYKKDIETMTYGLAEVMQLKPVSFYWNKESGRTETTRNLGLIAEDVLKVMPELVTYSNGQVQGLQYDKLTAVLAKAIQEQQKQIDNLKVGVVEVKRSAEENWQWIALSLLFLLLLGQQWQIRKLKNGR